MALDDEMNDFEDEDDILDDFDDDPSFENGDFFDPEEPPLTGDE